MDNLNNTITEAELDAFLGETHRPIYHANHLISDKNIDPKSPNFGKKGESYFIKGGGGQWYIKYAGALDFTRVQWWQLESNVSDGEYGKATYKGINASILGKVGELSYVGKQWIFAVGDEKYKLNNPASVELM